MDERIKQLAESLGVKNADYCKVLGSHDIMKNTDMACPFRSGEGRIEYNPNITVGLTNRELQLNFMAEIQRILLGHPYESKPIGCSGESVAIASNLVLADKYDYSEFGFRKPADYGLPSGESYDFYAQVIEARRKAEQREIPTTGDDGGGNNGSSGEDNGGDNWMSETENHSNEKRTMYDGFIWGNTDFKDVSELWEEDEDSQYIISETTDSLDDEFGIYSNIGSRLEDETITSDSSSGIDFRRILSVFRDNMQHSSPILTRMRPNRRMGFERMGRKSEFHANLLLGIDVSGSVDSESLQSFLSVINKLFKYGIDKLDVVTFDTELGDIITFKNAKRELSIRGRGGTDFNPIIKYYCEQKDYQGLIIFTDGYAPPPDKMKRKKRIVWAIDTEDHYKYVKHSLEKSGICCYIKNRKQ